jgi:excisionase family DNA binding protein
MARLLTAGDVAERLELHPRTVLRLAREGRLRRVKLGHRTVRFVPEDVEAYIEGERQQQDAPAPLRERLFDDNPMPTRF